MGKPGWSANLLRELRRRKIFRAAALYIVGTWLVMQVADVVFPALDIPERAMRYVLLAALMGFPAALVFGWFFDIGAQGVTRTGPAGAGEPGAARPLRRSDYLILTALVGVAAAILYSVIGNLVQSPDSEPQAARSGPPVVAVLPFTASGLEGDSAFFANGVHDDLLTQLAKLQSIRVISRTSVLEYRGVERNLREIGAALGADVILEGGVQVGGAQIRINAQLIDARTDEHMWAETYSRSLSTTDIFDVQRDIARAITRAMHATLTEQDDQQLSVIPTENMAAYRAYRRAMEDRSHKMDAPETVALLEEAVTLDPMFVRAWAELTGAYALRSGGINGAEFVRLAEEALQRIREIGPDSAEYLIAQTYYVYFVLKDYDQAYGLLSRAVARQPSDMYLLELSTWIERRQGKFDRREKTLRSMMTLDPRNPQHRYALVAHLLSTHHYDAALDEATQGDQADPSIAELVAILRLKDHRDFPRFRQEMKALYVGREEAGYLNLWLAEVANRDYRAAAELLARVGQPERKIPGRLTNWDWAAIWTYRFLDDSEHLPALLAGARGHLEASRQHDGEFPGNETNIFMALVAAAEGNTEESVRLLRRWENAAAGDWTDIIILRDSACAVLGLNAAVSATVECLRSGLREPSYVMPFLDPYMPYYDSIRDEPEFVEFVAGIEAAAQADRTKEGRRDRPYSQAKYAAGAAQRRSRQTAALTDPIALR